MGSYAAWLFGTAAAVNLAIGAGLLFVRPWLAALLGLDPIAGTNLVLVNLTGTLIVVFGYAYVCVARDPVRYRPYIPLAVMGKLLAVGSVVWPWLAGAVPWTLPALAGADLVYALLFLDFLRRTPPP